MSTCFNRSSLKNFMTNSTFFVFSSSCLTISCCVNNPIAFCVCFLCNYFCFCLSTNCTCISFYTFCCACWLRCDYTSISIIMCFSFADCFCLCCSTNCTSISFYAFASTGWLGCNFSIIPSMCVSLADGFCFCYVTN